MQHLHILTFKGPSVGDVGKPRIERYVTIASDIIEAQKRVRRVVNWQRPDLWELIRDERLMSGVKRVF